MQALARSTRPLQDRAVRVVGYTRVSTEEQAQHGLSVRAQQDRLEAFCAAHGFDLVDMEGDDGVSGKVSPDKRQGLADALQLISNGGADGLLVLKLDRLSRSTRDVLNLVDESGRDGWRLISVSEHLDTGTAAGRMVVTVLAALAQMEREQAGERTKLALDRVAREGRARSRRTPFGWRLPDGSFEQRKGDRSRLVKHPEEQVILERMFFLNETQGLGARRIANDLNQRGDLNPRTDKEWTPQLVHKIIATARRLQALRSS